jgi:iron complex transport system ATP-binding protein
MRLTVNDVMFSYNSAPVLDDISFELARGEILSIVGPNGTGKSTLLRCLDGLIRPNKGSIFLASENIRNMDRSQIARHLGYVPQSFDTVFPLKVLDMVLLGRHPRMLWKRSRSDLEKAYAALQLMGIENLAMRNFNEISGGQQQKVIIARALAQEAQVLLLDEPTSNLDIMHQLEVMELIKRMVSAMALAVVVSVHDLNLAARYSDRVLMLHQGRIVAAGDPLSVFTTDNIAAVYHVKARVNTVEGRPHIIPLKPLQPNEKQRSENNQ